MRTANPEVFDREQALAATAGDEELLRELVGLFLDDCPRMVREVSDALALADAEALRRAAHTLKGSVGVLGARALAAVARDVEEAAKAGDLGAARAAHARLAEEAKRLAAVLEGLVGR